MGAPEHARASSVKENEKTNDIASLVWSLNLNFSNFRHHLFFHFLFLVQMFKMPLLLRFRSLIYTIKWVLLIAYIKPHKNEI